MTINGYVENRMLDGPLVGRLRADVDDLFQVIDIEIPRQLESSIRPLTALFRRQSAADEADNVRGVVIFVGELLHKDSEFVYDQIAERWRAHHYTPMLQHYKGKVALIAQPGLIIARPSNPKINFWLGIATIVAMLLTGSMNECQAIVQAQTIPEFFSKCFPLSLSDWSIGIPMMLVMMSILTAHEFGHYFAARYHKISVTLPYFIPLPIVSPVGTLGAVIQLRSPFKTKKQLFDIGVAGPLGGLIFAIPIIFWAVANSPITEIVRRPDSTFSLEGNSIFYLLVKYIVHGQILPNFDEYSNLPVLQQFFLLLGGIVPSGGGTDILLNSAALAAWFGLFVTAMNLLPVGQLDGGHVIYCLLGEKARTLSIALMIAMFVAGILTWPGWFVWAFITFFLIGPDHPPPLNGLAELGLLRTVIAYGIILIFLVLFMPNPFQIIVD